MLYHRSIVFYYIGLTPGVTYEFFVYARNGVSDQVVPQNLTNPTVRATPSNINVILIAVGVVIASFAVVFLVIISNVVAFFL